MDLCYLVLLPMMWFVSLHSNYKDLEEVCCQAEVLARPHAPSVLSEELYDVRLWTVFLSEIP